LIGSGVIDAPNSRRPTALPRGRVRDWMKIG